MSKAKTQHIPGSWKNKIVNSDLQEERDKCDFDGKLGGGIVNSFSDEHFNRLQEAQAFMDSDPIL